MRIRTEKGGYLAAIEDKSNTMQSQPQTLIKTHANLRNQSQIDHTVELLFESGFLQGTLIPNLSSGTSGEILSHTKRPKSVCIFFYCLLELYKCNV
jgi:hypothetical protein